MQNYYYFIIMHGIKKFYAMAADAFASLHASPGNQ